MSCEDKTKSTLTVSGRHFEFSGKKTPVKVGIGTNKMCTSENVATVVNTLPRAGIEHDIHLGGNFTPPNCNVRM